MLHRAQRLLTIAAAVLATSASAQPAPAPPLPVLPQPNPAPTGTESVAIDSLGLTAPIPEGAIATSRSIGGVASIRIDLPGRAGVVLIETRSFAERKTAQDITSDIIKALLGIRSDYGVADATRELATSRGRLVAAMDPRIVAGAETTPFFVELGPAGQPETEVRAYAVAPIASNRLADSANASVARAVIVVLVTTNERLEDARRSYETVLRGVDVTDPAITDARRADAIAAGQGLLSRLDADTLTAFARTRSDAWQRLYRPGDTGGGGEPEEVGYRRIRVEIGPRGRVSEKPQERWTAAEREIGLLLRIDARLLTPGGGLVDSASRYFLSFDRTEENWLVTNAIRADVSSGATEVWTETGARDGDSMTVQVRRGRAAPRSVRPLIQGAGYASRPESYLMTELIASADLPGTYGFYAYDQTTESVRYREDRAARIQSGGWTIRTQRGEGQGQTVILGNDNRPIRISLDSGLVWEPIELDELFALWRSKGLPLD